MATLSHNWNSVLATLNGQFLQEGPSSFPLPPNKSRWNGYVIRIRFLQYIYEKLSIHCKMFTLTESSPLSVSYIIRNQPKPPTTTQNQPKPPTIMQQRPTTSQNHPQLTTTTQNKPKPDTATQNSSQTPKATQNLPTLNTIVKITQNLRQPPNISQKQQAATT